MKTNKNQWTKVQENTLVVMDKTHWEEPHSHSDTNSESHDGTRGRRLIGQALNLLD